MLAWYYNLRKDLLRRVDIHNGQNSKQFVPIHNQIVPSNQF